MTVLLASSSIVSLLLSDLINTETFELTLVHLSYIHTNILAFLDNLKAPLDWVAHDTKYYQHTLLIVFQSLEIPTSNLRFVEGSSYHFSREYNMNNYILATIVTKHNAKKAGTKVMKQVESSLLGGLLYSSLQVLDEQYLGCDFQFGGVD